MERASSGAVDTLAIFQRLKNANLQEEAASEIAVVLKDVVEANTVTRGDLEQVKSDLQNSIELTKADLELKIEQVKSDLKLKIEQVKSDLELKIEQSKTELVRWVAGLMIAQAAVIVALIKLI
jgi:hypothetical protein